MELHIDLNNSSRRRMSVRITQEMIDNAKCENAPVSISCLTTDIRKKEVLFYTIEDKTYAIYFKGNSISEFKELRGFKEYGKNVFKITNSVIQWCDRHSSNIDIINILTPEIKFAKHDTYKWNNVDTVELYYHSMSNTTLKFNNTNDLLFMQLDSLIDKHGNLYDVSFDGAVCSDMCKLYDAIVNYCKNYLNKYEKI